MISEKISAKGLEKGTRLCASLSTAVETMYPVMEINELTTIFFAAMAAASNQLSSLLPLPCPLRCGWCEPSHCTPRRAFDCVVEHEEFKAKDAFLGARFLH